MPSVIQKTFGGLSPQYYFRQLFFGAGMAAFIFYAATRGGSKMPIGTLFFIGASALLYPYSRFVYERTIGFLIGENIFIVNAVFMLLTKLMTMMICWASAIFLAPIGLAYLYCRHRRARE